MASMPTPAEIIHQEKHISDDKIPNIIAANAICFPIACIAVLLRFVSRRMSKIKYEADDWLIIAGLLFTLGVLICDCVGLRFGLGRHLILLKNPAGFAQMLISAEVIYNFAMFAIKASILYLYKRVFFISRNFVIVLWAVGIFVACYSITQVFAAIFQCMPIDSNWNPLVKHYCINTDIGATIIAAFNVLTDFAILVLPLPLLYKLQKPTKERIQIMGMFLLGGFVCFASIYRCIVIHELSHADPSWSDVPVNIWTIVELCTAIVSACLPTMRPLFSRATGKFGSGSEESGMKNSPGSDPSLNLKQTPSDPSQSRKFAHIGVLGNLEHGQTREVSPSEKI